MMLDTMYDIAVIFSKPVTNLVLVKPVRICKAKSEKRNIQITRAGKVRKQAVLLHDTIIPRLFVEKIAGSQRGSASEGQISVRLVTLFQIDNIFGRNVASDMFSFKKHVKQENENPVDKRKHVKTDKRLVSTLRVDKVRSQRIDFHVHRE